MTNGDVDMKKAGGDSAEDGDTTTAVTAVATTQQGNGNGGNGPDRFKVRLTHPLERKKVVFSSVSEKRARRYIANHFPRGEEAYLEMPDGATHSYQAEREGPHGEDSEQWGEFDPDSWIAPEEAPPPGEAAWADVEA